MGFLNDVSVTLFDKIDRSDPKKRKDYWMKTIKTITMVTYGLYIEDSVIPIVAINVFLYGCKL